MTLTTVALCTLCLTFLEPMVYIWININENIDRTYSGVASNLKRPGRFFQMVSDSSWQPFEGHPLSNSVILFQCVLLCVTTLIFPETWQPSKYIRTPITPCRNLEVHREIKKNINALTLSKLCATIFPLRLIFQPNNNNGQVVYPITNVPLVDQCVNVFVVLMFMKMKHVWDKSYDFCLI